MKTTNQELASQLYRSLLKDWKQFEDTLDNPILDLDYKSNLSTLFGNAVRAAMQDADAWGWLDWWVYENRFGEAKLSGTQRLGDEEMEIKTEEQLIAVLARMTVETV